MGVRDRFSAAGGGGAGGGGAFVYGGCQRLGFVSVLFQILLWFYFSVVIVLRRVGPYQETGNGVGMLDESNNQRKQSQSNVKPN